MLGDPPPPAVGGRLSLGLGWGLGQGRLFRGVVVRLLEPVEELAIGGEFDGLAVLVNLDDPELRALLVIGDERREALVDFPGVPAILVEPTGRAADREGHQVLHAAEAETLVVMPANLVTVNFSYPALILFLIGLSSLWT